jgi:Zn-dependent protease
VGIWPSDPPHDRRPPDDAPGADPYAPDGSYGARDPATGVGLSTGDRDDLWARPAGDERAPWQPDPSPHQPRQTLLRRAGGGIIAAALLLWKVVPFLFGALKGLKFVTTGASFLVSLAAYAVIWGWRFALGFLILLFVHEMGHVLQLRREGVKATAPLFIPFLGAVVGMKELPKNAWVEAKVGLAGPVLGSLGAAVVLAAAIAIDSDLLRAIAYVGFFLNLFNLVPIVPLDGGRAAAVFHPAVWLAGLLVVLGLFAWHPNPIILLIVLFGGLEFWRRWQARNTPEARAYRRSTPGQRVAVGVVYVGLIVALIAGMDVSYVEREL